MPFDSNGNYSLPTSYFVENGDTVMPIQHNPPLEDIQQALSSVLLRSGVAPMNGDLKMGTKKVTGMAAGTASTDAVNKQQMDDVQSGLEAKLTSWEKIAFATPANVSQVIQTGLSGYKALRIHGWLVPSASAPILFQVSGDNGVTWAASNYQRLFTGVALGLTAANVDTVAEASAGYLTVTGRASRIHSFDQTIRRSNLGVEKIATGICAGIDSNNSFSGYIPSTFMFTAAAVPVTALRVFASSGTITGEINFEGIKV